MWISKLHKKPREACKSSWNRVGSLKSFTLTIPWNLAKLVKIFPVIIVRQHRTDRKLMGLLREQCTESRNGTSAVNTHWRWIYHMHASGTRKDIRNLIERWRQAKRKIWTNKQVAQSVLYKIAKDHWDHAHQSLGWTLHLRFDWIHSRYAEYPTKCEEMKERRKHEHIVDEEQWDFQNDKPKDDDEQAVQLEAKNPEKFGDLITADHRVLSEGGESRNNCRYAVVVQDLATQWNQSNPCKTTSSQETQKGQQKFLEPTRKPKVIYTDNSFGIRQSLWRSFLESLHVDTTQIGNKWDCWESSAQSETRDICGVVAIRCVWKRVGRFHGMLLLSAKHSRSLV